MPEPGPDVPAGEPVTSLILSLTRESSGVTWPGTTAAIAHIPGHHPDLLAQIATALDEAADGWEPMRCRRCIRAAGACGPCRGDESKVRAYRSLAETLRAAR